MYFSPFYELNNVDSAIKDRLYLSLEQSILNSYGLVCFITIESLCSISKGYCGFICCVYFLSLSVLNWSLRSCGSGSACDLLCCVYHTVHSPSGLSTCLFIVAQPKLDVIPIVAACTSHSLTEICFLKDTANVVVTKRAPRKCHPKKEKKNLCGSSCSSQLF